jgi:hypothetical protein
MGFAIFWCIFSRSQLGWLIALGLEGCVEWRRHRHLVAEARENLRSEFRDNQKAISDARDSIHREQAQAKDDIRTLKTLEDAKTAASIKGGDGRVHLLERQAAARELGHEPGDEGVCAHALQRGEDVRGDYRFAGPVGSASGAADHSICTGNCVYVPVQ